MLRKWWSSYKYRFTPWIALNVKSKPVQEQADIATDITPNPTKSSKEVPVHHLKCSEELLVSSSQLVTIMSPFLQKLKPPPVRPSLEALEEAHERNKLLMLDHFGFTVEKRLSSVQDAGTGVFVSKGKAKKGSVVALYCGTIYLPSEPLFFPSLGNPYIFRCKDGIHIDGNHRLISKSIYKSCAARDKFDLETQACDTSWLTPHPLNPLNVGQFVNNQSSTGGNNVMYQECNVPYFWAQAEKGLERDLFQFLPNVWNDPQNGRALQGLRVVPLVALRDIFEGEELFSAYFTVVHS